jgi:hypothetical protein
MTNSSAGGFMRQVLITSTILAFSAAAWAQTPAPPAAPLPVEQMTCEQLYAETAQAGMRMAGQMDPSFAANAMAMYNRANDPAARAQAFAEQSAVTAACGIQMPVANPACMAMQQQQAARAQVQTQQNLADMNRIGQQVQQSMAGIDIARMEAIERRLQALRCPPPPQP